MSEEGLWKQIEEIIAGSDFEADYEDALSKGNMSRASGLWADRASKQLGKTSELLDEAMEQLDKTMEQLKKTTKYAGEVVAIGHALVMFIEQRGLLAEFEQWALQYKGFKGEFVQLVKEYKERRGAE